MVSFGSYAGYKEIVSYAWKPTMATVTESGYVRSRLPSQPGYMERVRIEYKYVVGSIEYVSDQIAPGPDWNYGILVSNKDLMKKCRVNSRCEIFYDPDNPASSAMRRGIQVVTVGMFFGGLLLLFLATRSRIDERGL
jgi:hypothetical protein